MGFISLGSNITSLRVQRQLGLSTRELWLSLERLSTGQRINRASDDAAGLAIADSLRSQSRLFSAAQRNVNDGVSLINIASGTLAQQMEIIGRLKELAQQGANGTYSDSQRVALNEEYSALIKEFGRLADSTSFNGQKLLHANRPGQMSRLNLQVGINGSEDSSLAINLADSGTFSGVAELAMANAGIIDGVLAAKTFAQVSALFNHQIFRIKAYKNGEERDLLIGLVYSTSAKGLTGIVFERGSDTGQSQYEWTVDTDSLVRAIGSCDAPFVDDAASGLLKVMQPISIQTLSGVQITLDLTGARFKNTNVTLGYSTQSASDLQETSLLELSGVETAARALWAISILNNRQREISILQGNLGAAASRLDTALDLMRSARENSLAAESRIRDSDIAEESSRLVLGRIVQQAAAAVLAQANQQPRLALLLLQTAS